MKQDDNPHPNPFSTLLGDRTVETVSRVKRTIIGKEIGSDPGGGGGTPIKSG